MARLRDLRFTIGTFPIGDRNAITNVASVSVGHRTVVRDVPRVARTGVTIVNSRPVGSRTALCFGGLAALVVLVIFSSCGAGPDGEVESPGDVLGAAAAHRVFVDNTFGGQDVFDHISVVSVVGRAEDDGLIVAVDASARELTPDERTAIEAALAPKKVAFVQFGATPAVDDDRLEAVLLFAEPSGGSAEAVVTTSMLCGGTCGAGGAQRFELTEDGWRFVENVGAQWVS